MSLLENQWNWSQIVMLSEISQSYKVQARGKQNLKTKVMKVRGGLLGRYKGKGKGGREDGRKE
jgi:hypothetical protein